MNKIQRELILDLKEAQNRLGHSPKQREIRNLAMRCYVHFKSFNKAKKIAGLDIRNVRIKKLLKNAFKKDKDLAVIVSYLTFDGGKHRTHKVFYFNKTICEGLFNLGVPKGDKVIQAFNVPRWIVSSRELTREYLKIAYFCEGCFKESKGRTPRIAINLAKSEDLIKPGLIFMNQLRIMLRKFNIDTKECFLIGRRIRKKDGIITRDIRFRVEIKDNNNFIREIGWLK